MPWDVQFRGGVWLPQLGWWLDARFPVERSFVSHAHFDHIAAHREILCSAGTARLLQARLPFERVEHILPFGQTEALSAEADVTLHPAGHIFGSAQCLIRHRDHGSLLYTGDFKLRAGLSAEVCATPQADLLIMETTFGLPHYVFPPTDRILADIGHFCHEAIDQGETPILFGYSLGKSQELLRGLERAGLPVMLHPQTLRLTKVYEEFGLVFPPYRAFEASGCAGHVVICPPQSAGSSFVRKISPRKTAVVTGWAVDAACVYRYQCDAAFPLSDHADYPDLLRFVERVRPKRVLTLHGFASEFALTLRQKGIDAWAIGEDNQLEIDLDSEGGLGVERVAAEGGLGVERVAAEGGLGVERVAPNALGDAAHIAGPLAVGDSSALGATRSTSEFSPPSALGATRSTSDFSPPSALGATRSTSEFSRLTFTADLVAATPKKLEKIALLRDYFATLTGDDAGSAALFFTGRPFPQSDGRSLQLGWAVLKRAILAVSGLGESDIRAAYHRFADSGDTAEALLQNRTRAQPMTLSEAALFFESLAIARGPAAKLDLLEARFSTLSPAEVKYLVKIATGDLRIGLKEGLVEEAVAASAGQPIESIREANMLSGDIAAVARSARAGTLARIELKVFHPLQFMLASPEPTAEAVLERLGAPVWLEEKYDGIRCQVHRRGPRAEVYSRDLHRITDQFPDLARAALALPGDFILDGELLAWRDGRALPFAELQKRLGRKGDDFFLGAEIPVSVSAYDLLWRDGRVLLAAPLSERRRLLAGLISSPGGAARAPGFVLAPTQEATGVADIEAAFLQSRARGNEGLMAKDPRSAYTPGRRGLAWIKLKKAHATLDVVVVGVEYGHGKRREALSDYTFAIRDTENDRLLTVGKAYSGLTDLEIAHFTQHFLERTVEVRGRYRAVVPDVVLEVAFDAIQPSARHQSGFALRFPRIVRIRTDKTPSQIDTLETCRRLAGANGFVHADPAV